MLPNRSCPPEDRDLIRRLVASEPAATAELYTRYYRLLVDVARGKFRFSREDAEDVAGEVILALLTEGRRRLRSFRGASSLSTWLVSITRRRCLDVLRRRLRETPGACRPAVHDPRPGMIVRLTVEQWLERSPACDQALLLRFYFEGASHEELARATGLAPGTIGARLNRARARIQRTLSPACKNLEGPRVQ
jgi:RNA polymerase sigma-70 factor (ECF subfamily)